MVDWYLARRLANLISGMQPVQVGDSAPRAERLVELTRLSEVSVSEYTGLTASYASVPQPLAVDRAGWIDANMASIKAVIDPATARFSKDAAKPIGLFASSVLTFEVGVLSGLLSQRVLGQYEFPLLRPTAPAQLLYVAPNLADAADKLSTPVDELAHWVALHETTHALQFGAVPWLREYVHGMITKVLESVELKAKTQMNLPTWTDVQGVMRAVREGEITTLFIGDERRALVAQMQAFMSVIEGYAEHVMDVVGAREIPELPRMRIAFDQRRQQRTGLLRLIERLLGMELKMRQYEQGKVFCDSVVRASSIDVLNRVWESAEMIPSQAEIEMPEMWLKRIGTMPQLTG